MSSEFLPSSENKWLYTERVLRNELTQFNVYGFYSDVLCPEPFDWMTFASLPLYHAMAAIGGGIWHITAYDRLAGEKGEVQMNRLYLQEPASDDAFRLAWTYPIFIYMDSISYYEPSYVPCPELAGMSIQKEDVYQALIEDGLALYAAPLYSLEECLKRLQELTVSSNEWEEAHEDVNVKNNFKTRWISNCLEFFGVFMYDHDDSNALSIYCKPEYVENVEESIRKYVAHIGEVLSSRPKEEKWSWTDDGYYLEKE